MTLTAANLPAHNHILPAINASAVFGGNSESGGAVGNEISSSATNTDGADHQVTGAVAIPQQATSLTGSNVPFSNRNPFLGVYVSIALVGIFPSRN